MGLLVLKRVVFSFLSILLFVCLHSSLDVASDSAEEAHALLKWKASLQNQNHPSLLPSWILYPVNATNTSTKLNPCTWFGISCNQAKSVVSINLTSTSLKGTLHQFSFSSFSHLSYLDLSMNQLFGNIPSQIGLLSELKYLGLSANQLSGEIPPEIGLLIHLEILYISRNQLNGSIPEEIG